MKVVKISKKYIILIALIIVTITFMSTTVYGIDTNFYEPNAISTPSSFYSRIGIVLGWIKYIGILVAVVALTIIGIKYLFGSVEGKAEYKKTLLPYVLGCFLLIATSSIVGLIADVADTTVKPEDTSSTTATWWQEDGGAIECDYCGLIFDYISEAETEEYVNLECYDCGRIIRKINKEYFELDE